MSESSSLELDPGEESSWCSHIMISNVTEKMIEDWKKATHVLYRDIVCPDGIAIAEGEDGQISLIATKAFKKGETLFEYETEYFDASIVKLVIVSFDFLRANGAYEKVFMKLDLLSHTVNRGDNQREYFGYDSFSDHSCDPNNDYMYIDGSLKTTSIACKDISPGEKITCDYDGFDTHLDGTEFQCRCGAPNCRGILRG